MSKLTEFINWAIATCNADNVGYSTIYRQGQTVGGITYYDCSSFISSALTVAGYFSVNPWFTTYNMRQMLLDLGFTEFNPNQEAWKQGDIMWTQEHTEIVYDPDNYYCMGAHSGSYPLPEQVSISALSTKNYWEKGFRPPTEQQYRWYAKPLYGFFEQSEEETNNAMMIYSVLTSEGWTTNAIAAAVGNIRHESNLNPWRWQYDIIATPDNVSMEHGYGLVQYTPSGKYILNQDAQKLTGFNPNYLGHEGSAEDGTAQMLFTSRFGDWNYDRGGLIPPEYRMYYDDFKKSTLDVGFLSTVWLYCYEFPSNIPSKISERAASAEYFYELFQSEPPPPPPPPPPTPIPPYIRQSKFKIPFFTRSYKIY